MFIDGWNFPELSPNESIIDHMSSCRRALGEWKIEKKNLNAAKLIEDLKSKLDNFYSDDDATT